MRSGRAEQLARMLAHGFAYQGEPSAHRGGAPAASRSETLPPAAFVNFLQNHDQIGNRALGDRLEWSANPVAIEAALAITLLAPMPPLLFMGEEWGARTAFPFFCDFDGELADAIRNGRRKEFAEAYETFGDDVPDPLAPETFQAAKLNWNERDLDGAARLKLVKALLAVRRAEIVPRLAGAAFGHAEVQQSSILTAQWKVAGNATLAMIANLSDLPATRGPATLRTRAIWGGQAPERMPPWSVFWALEER